MENRIFGVGSVDDMTLDDYKATHEAKDVVEQKLKDFDEMIYIADL